jgi:SAM-dependent methyltransferase
VVEIAPARAEDWLLEVGAGTGEVGAPLARTWPGRYLALDLSLGMLAEFRRHRREARPLRRVRADAAAPWPLAVPLRIVFCARAAHLVGAGRLAAEVSLRRHRRGTWLVLGRVGRQPTSVRATLRRELRRRLAEAGRPGRDGASSSVDLLALLERLGGRPQGSRVVASWPVEERPRDALRAWRERPGLAGLAESELPAAGKRALLEDLERWALGRFGDLDRPYASEERYELAMLELAGGEP